MPKKKQAVHASGLIEVKITVGHNFSGKRIQKSFYGKSRQEARRKAQAYLVEQEMAQQTGKPVIQKEYTFSEWAAKWLEVYKKPYTTANGYAFTFENTVINHLVPYFGKASLADIKNADVQAFFSQKTNYSESMLSKMRLCLNGIFETAIENELCYKNPVKHIEYKSKREKSVKQTYTDEQADSVKAAAHGVMDEVIILLETGLRRGELLGLRWADIDLDAQTLAVNRSIADTPKGSAERVSIQPPKWSSYRKIPLLSQSVAVLKSLERNGEYVFPARDGQPQSPNTWSQRLKRFMQRLGEAHKGLPALTAHELRHTYGTILRRKGVDIYTIQKVMGHKDIKMTSEIYVHNEIDVLKSAIQTAFQSNISQ